jgi:thiol-disulfide isomerase/thioredoxin
MMKNLFYLFLLLALTGGCKSIKPAAQSRQETDSKPAVETAAPEIDFHDQTTWILGYFNRERLTHYPYSTWYQTGYDDYQPSTEALNNLIDISQENVSIKVVMGTWCPDSRREVPRYLKVLDDWKFPPDKVTFIGVDDAKQSPVGEYNNLNIERVPTFIIYKNNIETGRIIENPVTSLEQDMVNILTGMKNNK